MSKIAQDAAAPSRIKLDCLCSHCHRPMREDLLQYTCRDCSKPSRDHLPRPVRRPSPSDQPYHQHARSIEGGATKFDLGLSDKYSVYLGRRLTYPLKIRGEADPDEVAVIHHDRDGRWFAWRPEGPYREITRDQAGAILLEAGPEFREVLDSLVEDPTKGEEQSPPPSPTGPGASGRGEPARAVEVPRRDEPATGINPRPAKPADANPKGDGISAANQSRPLSINEAAILLGFRGRGRGPAKQLRTAMGDGTIRYRCISRQSFLFDISQFPEPSRAAMRGESSKLVRSRPE